MSYTACAVLGLPLLSDTLLMSRCVETPAAAALPGLCLPVRLRRTTAVQPAQPAARRSESSRALQTAVRSLVVVLPGGCPGNVPSLTASVRPFQPNWERDLLAETAAATEAGKFTYRPPEAPPQENGDISDPDPGAARSWHTF